MGDNVKVRRFEPGAQLAWMLDVDSGYRGSSQRAWQFVELQKLPGGRPLMSRSRVVVSDLADDRRLPTVVIEPLGGERVLVRSEHALAVQAYGETVPQRPGSTTDVPYGSVVRSGSLLFAPLYQEQVESIQSGAMTLPFIGGGADQPLSEAEAEAERELVRHGRGFGRRRTIVAVVMVALLLATAVAVFVASRPAIEQRRVLLAPHLPGDAAAREVFEQRLTDRLEEAGFEVVSPSEGEASRCTPEDLGGAEAWESCARSLYAGQIVTVGAEEVSQRPGLSEGSLFRVFRVSAQALSLERPGVRTQSFTVTSERATGEPVFGRPHGERLASLFGHVVLSELVGDEVAYPEFFASVPHDEYDRVVEGRRSAEGHAKARKGVVERHARTCARDDEALASAEEPLEVARRSDVCGEEYPFAVAPDGSFVLVQVETVEPFVIFGRNPRLRGHQSPERIDLVPLDGSPRRTLYEAQSLRDFASFAPDAGAIFVIESGRTAQGVIEIDPSTGEPRTLELFPSSEGVSVTYVQPSADGEWLLLWLRSGGERSSRPVLTSRRTWQLRSLDPEIRYARWVELQLSESQRPRPLIAAILPPVEPEISHEDEAEGNEPSDEAEVDEPVRQVVLIDPTTAEEVARLGPESRQPLEIAGVRDGRLLFTVGAPCAVASWSPGAEELELTELDRCVRRPAVIGDGDLLARAALLDEGDLGPRDDELVRIDLSTGGVQPLTSNRHDDRFLSTSAQSRTIAFGRVLSTRHSSVSQVVLLTADVPR